MREITYEIQYRIHVPRPNEGFFASNKYGDELVKLEITDWLRENTPTYCIKGSGYTSYFIFTSEEDAMAFKLRWC